MPSRRYPKRSNGSTTADRRKIVHVAGKNKKTGRWVVSYNDGSREDLQEAVAQKRVTAETTYAVLHELFLAKPQGPSHMRVTRKRTYVGFDAIEVEHFLVPRHGFFRGGIKALRCGAISSSSS